MTIARKGVLQIIIPANLAAKRQAHIIYGDWKIATQIALIIMRGARWIVKEWKRTEKRMIICLKSQRDINLQKD